MIAAHLTPKDLSLWKRLAQLSTEQGLIRQAVYCYSQAGGLGRGGPCWRSLAGCGWHAGALLHAALAGSQLHWLVA